MFYKLNVLGGVYMEICRPGRLIGRHLGRRCRMPTSFSRAVLLLKYTLIRETFYVFLLSDIVHEKTVKDSKARSSRLIYIILYHSDNNI
jgi:hypothetical protein